MAQTIQPDWGAQYKEGVASIQGRGPAREVIDAHFYLLNWITNSKLHKYKPFIEMVYIISAQTEFQSGCFAALLCCITTGALSTR